MKNLRTALLLSLTTLAFLACESQEKTARNGIPYSVLRTGEGAQAEEGKFLVMNVVYKDKNTDSVWADTKGVGPMIIPVTDSLWLSKDKDLQVIFGELRAGDSVTFDISVEDFFRDTYGAQIPPYLKPESTVQFNIGVQHVFNQQEAMAWKQDISDRRMRKLEAEAQKQYEVDVELIENYLAENSITTQKTESGVYYEIIEEGIGEKPAPGSSIRVNYTGQLLTGEVFDSSNEDVAKENGLFNPGRTYEPLEFTVGMGQVIKGWDEGFLSLNEGTKGRLFIPSTLAYGPRQKGAVIGPNSILVFDVELIEVK